METDFDQVKALIANQLLEKEANAEPEEAFIQLIAKRVEELMESNMELFINHLYRMDIDEKKVSQTLLSATELEESVYMALARLIYQRQQQRLETKRKYRSKNTDFWAEG